MGNEALQLTDCSARIRCALTDDLTGISFRTMSVQAIRSRGTRVAQDFSHEEHLDVHLAQFVGERPGGPRVEINVLLAA